MQPVDPTTAYYARIAALGETGVPGFGRQGQISPDTGGSKSYGVFGLNTRGRNNSASQFAAQFGPHLGLTAAPGTPEFDGQWRALAQKNPEALQNAQMLWFNNTVTSKVAPTLTQLGIPDSVANDPRVQGYFSDRMVQQGPASTSNHAARIQSAFAQSGGDPVAFLQNVSAADKGALSHDFRTYLSENPQNAQGLANRVDRRTSMALGYADDTNTGAPKVDMPVLSSGAQVGPGVLNDPDAEQPSIGQRFWNGYTQGDMPIANAMQQAGAYLMSIGDPKAGASMLSAINTGAAYRRALQKGELKQIGTDIYGNPQYAVFDPVKRTLTPANLGGGASTANATGGSQPQLAPGVDESLKGYEYLNQFPKDFQDAVKAHINGDVIPSAYARNPTLGSRAKLVAQRVGADEGIDVSDTLYAQRKQYRTQLGSGSASSVGGQVKAFNQAVEHLAHAADAGVELQNSSGAGIPLIAQGVNAARQFADTNQAAKGQKMEAIAQTLAGEVGKLFSGASGGGMHERDDTRKRFSSTQSPEQIASALEAQLDVMQGGLTALEAGKERAMGAAGKSIQFVSPETQKKIEHIKEVIAQLRGANQGPAVAGPAASAPGIDDLLTKYGPK